MAFLVIWLKVPLHPLCIAAIVDVVSSTSITGTQSAVKAPIITDFSLVTIASPSFSIKSFLSLS